MTFQPKYLILHDYGTNNAYGGGNIGFNPYHALVRGGQVQYRYPDNPYGQSAPHAYRLNPQAIGLSWYGPSGGKPNEADLVALKSEVARIKKQFPDIQVMSHGQAYANRGSLPRASKLGRGLDEAAWRSELGFGDAPSMTDVPQGPTPMAQRGLTSYAGLTKTPQEAPSMPTYKDVGGQVPQMAPGTSPADVAHAQAMAKMLMQGGQGQPRHWAQALGNAMQQLVGGLWQEQAARGEREGQAGANAALAAALTGGQPDVQSLLMNPRTAQAGQALALEEMKRRREASMPGDWKKIGQDEFGRETYGFVNPRTSRVTPYGAPSSEPKVSDGLNIPPGVDPVQFRRELAKKEATNRAEARKNLPGTMMTAGNIISTLKKLDEHPSLPKMLGNVANIPGTSIGVARESLPNMSEGANEVQALIDQVGGQAFLEAFKSLRGGGQITEAEGNKATDAITTLRNVRQGEPAYRQAIKDLKQIAINGARNAKRMAEGLEPIYDDSWLKQDTAPPETKPENKPTGQFEYMGVAP